MRARAGGSESAQPLGTLHDEDAGVRALVEPAANGDARADEIGDGGTGIACRGRTRDRIQSARPVLDECERAPVLAAVQGANAVLLAARTVAEEALEVDDLPLEGHVAGGCDREGPGRALGRFGRERAKYREQGESEYRKPGNSASLQGEEKGRGPRAGEGERLDPSSSHAPGLYYEPVDVAMPTGERGRGAVGGGRLQEGPPRRRTHAFVERPRRPR